MQLIFYWCYRRKRQANVIGYLHTVPGEYEKAIHNVAEDEREKIQQYMDSIEYCAEEENQQAYLQGIVDSMMILSGIGLLQPEERIMNIIQYLK